MDVFMGEYRVRRISVTKGPLVDEFREVRGNKECPLRETLLTMTILLALL